MASLKDLPPPVREWLKHYICRATSFVMIRPFCYLSNVLSRSGLIRYHLLFDAFRAGSSTTVIYTNFGSEEFLVDTRDRVIGKAIFGYGGWEFEKFLLTMTLLNRHTARMNHINIIIDVGANVGSICIPAVARGYADRGIAIEPHPHNCKLLRANLALNGLTNSILVHESACGAVDGEGLELEVCEDNFGDHRIRLERSPGVDNEAQRQTVHVQSNRLDTLCSMQPDPDALIWMDTQGYEGYVLAGGRRWLDAGTAVVLEFWPYGMRRVKSFQLLKDSVARYAGFYDLRDPNRFYPIKDLDRLYQQPIHTDLLIISTLPK